MKHKQLAATVLAALTMAASAVQLSVSAAPDLEMYANEVILLVNEERKAAGLAPLYTAPLLNTVAAERSGELVQTFSHTRPNGTRGVTILGEYGIGYSYWGENIAAGYASPEAVMDGWMNSSGHRANILNSQYNYIGVGVTYQNGALHWTEIFTADSQLSGVYLPTVMPGDVNRDSDIDPSDASLVLTAISRMGASQNSGLNLVQLAAADYNQDGEISPSDASGILLYIARRGAGAD